MDHVVFQVNVCGAIAWELIRQLGMPLWYDDEDLYEHLLVHFEKILHTVLFLQQHLRITLSLLNIDTKSVVVLKNPETNKKFPFAVDL